MQRFTLVHDGSGQGWQTAYLAFHVAARLGAPLQVLLFDSAADQELLTLNATQLQTGGRAAGVSLETQFVTDFSIESVTRNMGTINGLFVPNRLLPDEKTAAHWLQALSCPLWIVSDELKTRKMAVLVEDPTADEDLIGYATVLSQRMSETLTGFILGAQIPVTVQHSPEMDWIPLQDFSAARIASALDQLHADLLCLKHLQFSLARELGRTCVIYPEFANA
jgi:hypothetical protein